MIVDKETSWPTRWWLEATQSFSARPTEIISTLSSERSFGWLRRLTPISATGVRFCAWASEIAAELDHVTTNG